MKSREQRQMEAQERQAEHDRRNPQEQLKVLETRPGDATKEVAKLSGLGHNSSRSIIHLRRRARKAGLKKDDVRRMTPDALLSAVVSAERAKG